MRNLGELDIIYKVCQHLSVALGSPGAKPKSGDTQRPERQQCKEGATRGSKEMSSYAKMTSWEEAKERKR
jgi:hypothetical protein